MKLKFCEFHVASGLCEVQSTRDDTRRLQNHFQVGTVTVEDASVDVEGRREMMSTEFQL